MSVFFPSLNELDEFVRMTDTGLKCALTEGDYSHLVEVTGLLLSVKERQVTTDRLFEPLKDIVALLERYDQTIPGHVYTHLEVRCKF